MTVISIRQPCFAPWLGFFHELKMSDIHVFLDDVQYGKNSWNNRNKIRGGPGVKGWSWLTVPVLTRGKSDQLLNQAKISYQSKWRKKHLRTLEYIYSKAPFYKEVMKPIRILYNYDFCLLSGLNEELIKHIAWLLGLKCEFYQSSQITYEGKKQDLVIDICRQLKADTYVTGVLGKDYIVEKGFKDEGIELVWNEYKSPQYPQVYHGFEPNLSVLDAWFNVGIEGIKELI